jgi:ribose transport system ATP-binding protein
MKEEILRLENLTQVKDEVLLLDNFNLHIFKGEIMGLVCLNDHGRNSLMEIICQNVPIHFGRVYFNDQLVNDYIHSSMSRNKVALIEKQSKLVEDLTVVDNIFVLRRGFKKYLINKKVLNSQFQIFAKELELSIDGKEYICNLSPFEKIVVELLQAIIHGVKLILVKDISNFISAADLKRFQSFIQYYSKQGYSFIYICNHHEEAFQICSRVSLMENGKILKVLNPNEFNDAMMAPYIAEFYNNNLINNSENNSKKQGILSFEQVYTKNFRGISFTVQKGECSVILDVNNTVLTDIMELMSGEKQPDFGKITLDGKDYYNRKNKSALKKGIGFINEQPTKSMIFYNSSYLDNLIFLVDQKISHIRISKKLKKSIIQEYEPYIGKDIYETKLSSLSPFSLYNLVYYRLHLCNPKIVFCMQPFYNADMYLRKHILFLINELKQKGITVILLTVSLEDSLMVADRVLIFEEGRLRKEYLKKEFSKLEQMKNQINSPINPKFIPLRYK